MADTGPASKLAQEAGPAPTVTVRSVQQILSELDAALQAVLGASIPADQPLMEVGFMCFACWLYHEYDHFKYCLTSSSRPRRAWTPWALWICAMQSAPGLALGCPPPLPSTTLLRRSVHLRR